MLFRLVPRRAHPGLWSPYGGGPGNETHEIHVKLLSGSIHSLAGRMKEFEFHNPAHRFALLSRSPWGADVVNLLTTPGLKRKHLTRRHFLYI